MITETLEFEGHIIDSLLLPKVLDTILSLGADFEIETLNVGKLKEQPSYVRIKVTADDQAAMDELLTVLAGQGAHTVLRQMSWCRRQSRTVSSPRISTPLQIFQLKSAGEVHGFLW